MRDFRGREGISKSNECIQANSTDDISEMFEFLPSKKPSGIRYVCTHVVNTISILHSCGRKLMSRRL